MGRELLASASQKLDDFLPSALLDAMDRLKHLHDPRLARRVTEEAAERFCAKFEELEERLDTMDDENGFAEEGLRAVFPRTTAEIRVLLS
jgi:hypothetical protein